MKDIFGGTDLLLKQITDKKKGDRVQLVGFGSFTKTRTNDEKWERKRPGRIKYGNVSAWIKIAEKLVDKNPDLAKRFADAHELTHTVQQKDEPIIKATPAKRVSKFKAGADLADNVKSVDGGRTVGAGQVIDIVETKMVNDDIDELVNLTTDTEKNTVEVKSGETTQLEELGAEIELK